MNEERRKTSEQQQQPDDLYRWYYMAQQQQWMADSYMRTFPYMRGATYHSPPQTTSVSTQTVVETEVKIPAVWKRMTAEIIDVLVVAFLGRFFIYCCRPDIFNERTNQTDMFMKGLYSFEELWRAYGTPFEIYTGIVICHLYETLCLALVSHPTVPGGYTVGKGIMGIAVIQCSGIHSQGRRYVVSGMTNPTIYRSLVRVFMKSQSLRIPFITDFYWISLDLSLTAFLSDDRRTGYDLLAGTVVIEKQ